MVLTRPSLRAFCTSWRCAAADTEKQGIHWTRISAQRSSPYSALGNTWRRSADSTSGGLLDSRQEQSLTYVEPQSTILYNSCIISSTVDLSRLGSWSVGLSAAVACSLFLRDINVIFFGKKLLLLISTVSFAPYRVPSLEVPSEADFSSKLTSDCSVRWPKCMAFDAYTSVAFTSSSVFFEFANAQLQLFRAPSPLLRAFGAPAV